MMLLGFDKTDDVSNRWLLLACSQYYNQQSFKPSDKAMCRFGFGWDPARDPPPPLYTLHIKGLTDDTAAGNTGTVSWNLRGSYAKEEEYP